MKYTKEEMLDKFESQERLRLAAPKMLEALKEAKALIKFWHNGVDPHQDAWKAYQHSPEMKRINEAIKNAE